MVLAWTKLVIRIYSAEGRGLAKTVGPALCYPLLDSLRRWVAWVVPPTPLATKSECFSLKSVFFS